MKKLCFAFVAVAATAIVLEPQMRAQATVYQGTLTLPAYNEGLPDLNPPFDQYATARLNYPYTLRNNITSNRTEHAFRAIYLENEYLKCSVLPDLGGHIYTCIDKINNVTMFYANPSIKEAQIGMRGGWAAFGEEFNFPISHSWTTISPVDFAFGKESDGSATVTISNIERVSGMQWTVEILLRPGTTLLEQHVTLSNRDDVRHRFYWWSNAGVQVWDDSRICYPMRYTASHGYTDVDRWPLDSTGIDMSVLKNQTHGPVSRFIHGSREPYMGIWNPQTNAGVAHYADYAELPGKKIWSWGADADAMDWRHALSDNNSAYMEVQAGLFRNQETFAFLEPQQTIRFNEYWMPLRGLGGLARANLAGAVNLSRNGSTLTAALNVNRRLPGATVRLFDGDTVLRNDTEDLLPERTWKQAITLPDADHHYTLELRDNTGKVVLSQTEGKYDWIPDAEVRVGLQPIDALPPPAKRTDDDWRQAGRNDELNGRLLVAAATYADGIKRFPTSQSLVIAAGRVAVTLLHYDDAIALLTTAQARDTPNAQIAYYLGLAYDGLNDPLRARAQYEIAAHLPELRATATLRLGELEARSGNWDGATQWLKASLASAPDDLRAAEELVAVMHANKDTGEAHTLAMTWHKRFPTSYFLAEEIGTPDARHLAADSERVLNVAAEYMRLGRYTSALAVLSRQYPSVPSAQMEPGNVLPQDNAMVAYYQAFCLLKLGQPAASALAAASHKSVRYIFPSGAQSMTVLRAAAENNPHDATALDLLGTLEFSVGMSHEAQALWDRAHALNATLPALDANRGLAALYLDNDAAKALDAFQQGIQNDPTNQTNYTGTDQALSLLQHSPEEFIQAATHYPDKATMPAKLVYELALHYSEAANYSAAEALLHDRFFPREENGTNVRQVWLEVEMQRLGALSQEGRCKDAIAGLNTLSKPKSGMTFTRDGMEPLIETAPVQWQIAQIDNACHRTDAAQIALATAAQSFELDDVSWAYLAAGKSPGLDKAAWRVRLEAALDQTQNRASTHPFAMYETYMLLMELSRIAEARNTLQRVFLMPDEKLSYHLARLALLADSPPSSLNSTR